MQPLYRSLLAESAEIVLYKTSEATAPVRAIASQWHEQSVLDPHAAAQAALKLEQQLPATEAVLRELLARATAIAVELRALASEGR